MALIDDDDVLMYHIPNLTHPCLVAIVPNQSIFRQKNLSTYTTMGEQGENDSQSII